MIAHILEITVGQTFSGGCIDLILFGVLQSTEKTNWIYILPVGVAWFFLYYFSFKYLILKFNFKTLGREDEEIAVEVKAGKNTERANLIIEGLGGAKNILELDCCATRLRVTVNDGNIINEKLLTESGSRGIVKNGKGIQIIYGPQVTIIKNELDEILNF